MGQEFNKKIPTGWFSVPPHMLETNIEAEEKKPPLITEPEFAKSLTEHFMISDRFFKEEAKEPKMNLFQKVLLFFGIKTKAMKKIEYDILNNTNNWKNLDEN